MTHGFVKKNLFWMAVWFVGVLALSGCRMFGTSSLAEERTVAYDDLELACARIMVHLLDGEFEKFLKEYPEAWKESHPEATDAECIPQIYIWFPAEKQGLVTVGGRRVNTDFLTNKFKMLLGSPQELNWYMKKVMPEKFPEEYAELGERLGEGPDWKWKPRQQPFVTWTGAFGTDQAGGLVVLEREDVDSLEAYKTPELLVQIEMTQNTFGDGTVYLFYFRVFELTRGGKVGPGVGTEKWACNVELAAKDLVK
ncbi:MAG: hypothetical protein IKS83_06700 [Victivallales bacterium]|nr:hypothetical protein [Victivallales bacterium]